jgi:transcriptional regulator NrdR family protein
MECPHCGKIDNKVIDSRLTQEGIVIRRRRECLACAGRFSTYESTEEKLLRVLLWKDVRPGSAITKVKAVGKSMANAFRTLTEETEKLIAEVDKLEKAKAKAAKRSKRRAAAKVRAKKKARVKKPPARKARKLTDTAQVLKIIKRHKRGVDLKKLRDRTGFQDNKIRDIVTRACKTGKIKRVDRGVYIGAF